MNVGSCLGLYFGDEETVVDDVSSGGFGFYYIPSKMLFPMRPDH